MDKKIVLFILDNPEDLLQYHHKLLSSLPSLSSLLLQGSSSLLLKPSNTPFIPHLLNLPMPVQSQSQTTSLPSQNTFDQSYDQDNMFTHITGLRVPRQASVFRDIAMGSKLLVISDTQQHSLLTSLQIDYMTGNGHISEIQSALNSYDMTFIHLPVSVQHLTNMDTAINTLVQQSVYVCVLFRNSYKNSYPVGQIINIHNLAYQDQPDLLELIPEQSYLRTNGSYNSMHGMIIDDIEICYMVEYQRDMIRQDMLNEWREVSSLQGVKKIGNRNQHLTSLFKQFLFKLDRDMKFGS